MKKYYIVQEDSRGRMVDYVNSMMKEGWVPHGGLCHVMHRNPSVGTIEEVYSQAMVQYDTGAGTKLEGFVEANPQGSQESKS